MVAVWILLIPCLVMYCFKEVFIMGMHKRKYLRRFKTYRNLIIILSTIALIYDGPPDHLALSLPRWQFPLVSLTCLFLWLETTTIAGKIPRFGIYIHMFR